MNLGNINIQNYVYHFLKEMNDLYSLANKDIIFMFYEPNIDNARAILKMGAHRVYFYNPEYDYSEIENGSIVLLGNKNDMLSDIADKSIDLVIGLEILEHINNLDVFFAEVKRVIKTSGDIELQGSPMWTSQCGHHLWIENKYIFYDDSNPFEPWEHLIYKNKREMEKALIAKGLPKDDCKEIARWVYDPIEISRHTPSEIIEAATGLQVESDFFHQINFRNSVFEICKHNNFEYSIKRTFQKGAVNEFFDLAAEKYSEIDLNTLKLSVKIKHSIYEALPCVDLKVNTIENLDDSIFETVKEFNKLHNVKDRRIVNISAVNSLPVSKMFLALGAKSVLSISPFEFVKEEKTKNFKHYNSHFEDCDYKPEKNDIIFGLEVLNNLVNPDRFFEKIKESYSNDTVVYLTGYMPYTSALGHKVNTVGYHFYDSTNPLKYWQHLLINSREDFISALMENGAAQSYAEYIWKEYDKSKNIAKLSPSELAETASKYVFLHMRKIFHYFSKNEYYQKALEKYSEDDLNTMKIIISSDFPTLNWLDELDIDEYLKMSLSDINLKYKIKDKRVLNITPFINAKVSLGFESFQAKEVISLDFYDHGFELKGGKNIKCIKQGFEDLDNLDGQFDIIYGLDVLEHVQDLKKFYNNLRRLIDDNGVICLQGSPLWPSDNGHNCMLNNLDCGMLKTGEGSPSLEPWEHLAYDSKDELKSAMLKKGFTENDAELVSEFIFNSDEINRKSYSDFIEELKEIDGIYYGSKKILHYSEENAFYKKANQKYTHEELRTKELKLFIRKKLC